MLRKTANFMQELLKRAKISNVVVVLKLNRGIDLERFRALFQGKRKRNFVVVEYRGVSITAFSNGLMIIRNLKWWGESMLSIINDILDIMSAVDFKEYKIEKIKVVNIVMDLKLDTNINMYLVMERCKEYLLPWFEPEYCPFGIHLKGKYATYLLSPKGNIKILKPDLNNLPNVFLELEEILKRIGIDVN